ncbi:macrolide family glycosyltransferase [Saccharopolyspora phatthalungensis]|uniref:MGT family glycosyltransferase n=1 Tax=Saccharopolyspora phatthalungensis TaxID=664693 RepID=A0A840QIB8_9PSEU|nr:macrolide family glycosyltransferase [Saccharopolyspora phatthalungensis]MBB5158325.1 MGT family glycosyltransferase [Saccharopolyspora phatthalungensis]
MEKHFVFVSMPATGHVNPTLPLVTELLRRGHRVSYAVGHEMASTVETTGAEVVELPTEMPKIPQQDQFGPQRLAGLMRFMLDDIQASFPMLEKRFHADKPDAVCFDVMTTIGRMLAEKLGVPEIALVPNFASNENFSLRDALSDSNAEFPVEVFAEFGRRIQQLGAEFGVHAYPPVGAPPAGLNLVFLPREFQLSADTFDQRFRFLGPLLGDRAEVPWQPRDPHAPLLFISLGTAFNNRPDFYRMCFAAFADSPWQVAMSTGQHLDASELGPVPANFDVRPSFPQPAVLRHAAVFLSHTGMNSTMESLHAGVPLVAVPQMPEQAANAARVEELGLGRRLNSGTLTAADLRAAVDEVAADEQVRAHLDGMRQIIHDCGGAVAGADALEEHLS